MSGYIGGDGEFVTDSNNHISIVHMYESDESERDVDGCQWRDIQHHTSYKYGFVVEYDNRSIESVN